MIYAVTTLLASNAFLGNVSTGLPASAPSDRYALRSLHPSSASSDPSAQGGNVHSSRVFPQLMQLMPSLIAAMHAHLGPWVPELISLVFKYLQHKYPLLLQASDANHAALRHRQHGSLFRVWIYQVVGHDHLSLVLSRVDISGRGLRSPLFSVSL